MTAKLMSLAGLAEVDGGIYAEDFAERLRDAYDDCEDRPHVKGARKITLTVTLTPNPNKNGECESVDLWVDSKLTQPKRQGNKVQLRKGRGGLFFSEFSDDIEGQAYMFPEGPTAVEDEGDGTNG